MSMAKQFTIAVIYFVLSNKLEKNTEHDKNQPGINVLQQKTKKLMTS